jgi:L-rhamnose mutarotase
MWYDEVFHSDSGVKGEAKRGLFGLVVAPGRIPEYEALHANPWPDMIAALDAAGFRNYTGFRRGNHVVYYGEFVPDLETAMTRMNDFEVNARWGAAFEGIITTITDEDGRFITAREVFHQD